MSQPNFRPVTYRDRTYQLPAAGLGGTTAEPLLRPADRLLFDWAYTEAGAEELPAVAIYNDAQATLGTCVRAQKVQFVSDDYRHHARLLANYERNDLGSAPKNGSPLTPGTAAALNLLHVPKSLELYELYLRHVAATAGPETKLAAAFMTRNFTPRLLEIAAKYGATVEQSRAFKKARLLVVRDFKADEAEEMAINEMTYDGVTYQQYPGVFSAGHVDYATQFLLDQWSANPHLAELPAPATILDVGCGNGIIGDHLLGRYPDARLTAYDVSQLAVASTHMNLDRHGYTDRATVLTAASLTEITEPAAFDLIVTNPPFHEGHRTDISVSTNLFLEASERLSPTGHLVVVANRHLNYLTHLRRYFDEVIVVGETEKFVVYRSC